MSIVHSVAHVTASLILYLRLSVNFSKKYYDGTISFFHCVASPFHSFVTTMMEQFGTLGPQWKSWYTSSTSRNSPMGTLVTTVRPTHYLDLLPVKQWSAIDDCQGRTHASWWHTIINTLTYCRKMVYPYSKERQILPHYVASACPA